jgi:hypothetical protein
MVGYEFMQGVTWAFGILSILGAVPLLGKCLEVVEGIYAVGIENIIGLYEAGIFMVLRFGIE